MAKPLDAYKAKRDFSRTPEPRGSRRAAKVGFAYVIQKHAARRLHYDFRLELNGVMKSWAVPEGPSLVAGKKRLAVHVEDHPLEYGGFEGVIPKGEYGAGTVMIWDRGTWLPEFDPEFGYRKGHLKFRLNGAKLRGTWHLVRMAPKPREKQEAWLLFKSDDEAARPADAPDILADMPHSAATGRPMEAIARDQDRVWSSGRGEIKQEGKVGRRRKPAVDAAQLPKAKAGPLPGFVEPSLPSTTETAPSGAHWLHEIKYDGYRIQARLQSGRVELFTRQGLDWTHRFPAIASALAELPVKAALIDGEIVVQTETGVASFTALVDALKSGGGDFVFYAFDLLHLDGFDLREAPLSARKSALSKLLANAGPSRIRYSEHIEGDGDTVFRHATRLGLEGIVSKSASSPYRSGRVKSWLKFKSTQSDSFVIAGYIPSTVDPRSVGALVLGEYAGNKLVPSGHVGSGFTARSARDLWQTLEPLRTKTAPLKDETAVAKGVKWVEPAMAAEIEYRGRTGAGLIRHAVFRELVEGKVRPDIARPEAGKHSVPAKRANDTAPQVRLTNPARLLWPDQGITKQGLADFYTEIADWILPHVAGRPLSLLRCPGGIAAQCFFQKHRWPGLGSAVRLVQVPDSDEPMLAIDDCVGLLELVQASVLEIHPWGAMTDRPRLPDRVTIDLDPGDNVPWQRMVDAALEVRHRLTAHGLQSFVKTTGGKGLHVVFPLKPKADWDTVKAFAQSIATGMAAEHPDRYTANMAKSGRRGRIYVDYLRNGMGATAVAPYSTRARPGAAVSTPLSWDELGPDIRANHFTLHNLPKRLVFLDRDPWEGFLSLRQALPAIAESTVRAPPAPVVQMRGPSRRSAEIIGEPLPDAVVPTKSQLTAYWKKVGADALAHLGRRPLDLVRHVDGTTFYHRGSLPPVPDAVHQVRVGPSNRGDGTRPWVDGLEGLLGLLEIGTVELHPWGATIGHIERPDVLVFGLDPGDGIKWDFVLEAASRLRELLRAEGLESWPKLTGGVGIHVMVPVEPELDWHEAHQYSKEIAERLTASDQRYCMTSADRNRQPGRLFIDWLSNSRGATAVGAWSPRARRGFPVAAPVSWTTLERGVRPSAFTMRRPPSQRGT